MLKMKMFTNYRLLCFQLLSKKLSEIVRKLNVDKVEIDDLFTLLCLTLHNFYPRAQASRVM